MRGKLVEGADGIGGIHQRRAAAHIDRHAQRFLDFSLGCAQFDQRLRVETDAPIAARRIAQRQRDQFLGLFVQSPIFRCRASQGVETLRHLGQIGPKCGKVFGNALRMAARNVAALLRGLANEDRLLLLCQMTGGELSVGDLEVRVTTLRDGKRIFYSIDDAKVLDLLSTLYRLYCPENGVM